jgi:DNA invertase Pin-like site-specific DNA recombinase
VVVVERADRLHRDMQQFQATLELLHTHGVRFIAAREGLDLPS